MSIIQSNTSQWAKRLAEGYKLANTSIGVGRNQPLSEAKGWKEFVDGIGNEKCKVATALILENYKNYRQSLDETSTTLQVGNFDKFAFPLISIVSENLIAQELVSMQPLEGPSGQVFFMNFTTGQQKGDISRGASVWDSRTGHADRYLDSSDQVQNEACFACDANGAIDGNLGYGPIMPGTLELTDGDSLVIVDDSNGGLVNGTTGATIASASINYNTGKIVVADCGLNAATQFYANYNYNSELNDEAQQIDFEIISQPLHVRERKLRGRWSTEAAQALDALHKVDAEDTISTAIANHLQWEIDREIIEDLRRQAGAGTVGWDARVPQDSHISLAEHKLSLQDAAITASNFVLRATNRVTPNWLLTGIQGAGVIRTLPNFSPASGDKHEFEGVHVLGDWQGMKVYCDPRYRVDEALVGYQGSDWLRTGYIFAPWILLYTTPLVTLDDFITRKGFASQYAKKMLNSKMYARLQFSGFGASFGG